MVLMMVLETVAVELRVTMEEETGATVAVTAAVMEAATEAEVAVDVAGAVDVEADKYTN